MKPTSLLCLAFLSLVISVVHAAEGPGPGASRDPAPPTSTKKSSKKSVADPKAKQTLETYREYLATNFPAVSTTGATTSFKIPEDFSDPALRGQNLRMVSGTIEPTNQKNEVTVKTRDGREISLKVADFSEWLTEEGKVPLFNQTDQFIASEPAKSSSYFFMIANDKLYQAAKDDSPIAVPEPSWPKKPKPPPPPPPTAPNTPKGGTPTKGG